MVQPAKSPPGYWIDALAAAQWGDLGPARAAFGRLAPSDNGGSHAAGDAAAKLDTLSHYFYGRCLAEAGPEAGADMGEAILHLRRAGMSEPGNVIFLHALALALARSGDPAYAGEAALLWHEHGLPHDLDLLGASARVMEAQTRELPEVEPSLSPSEPGAPPVPWPDSIERPPLDHPEVSTEGVAVLSSVIDPGTQSEGERDKMSRASSEPATKSGARRLQPARKDLLQIEHWITEHDAWKALRRATEALLEGRESAELHMLAGIAALDTGAARRARGHLAKALALDPTLLMARTWLARAHWRLGWFDLAQALWRSLPVEGPYDQGRHYHLALGYDALGQPAEAAEAMRISLRDFFYDTRQFYIERAFWTWAERSVQMSLQHE